MEQKSNKGIIVLVILLIILFLIVLALLGYIVWDKNNNNNVTSTATTATINVTKENENITFNELVNLLKDAYINQKESEYVEDFYVDDNVEKWDIDSIKYLGYYEYAENIKYYTATGSFKCKNNDYTCIYMEQVDYETIDNIPFKANFAIKYNGSGYELDHIDSLIFDDLVKGEPEISEGFILVEKSIIK